MTAIRSVESEAIRYLCPLHSPDGQLRRGDHVAVTPAARIHSYTDYWGTRVDEFGIVEPHTRLRVEAKSTVKTTEPSFPDRGGILDSLDSVRGELSSYLRPSPHVVWTT